MRDALEFEWLQIPSVAIIADALTGPADAMRRLSGMPDHPYVVTRFPVGALDAGGVRARAEEHADEVLRLLTDPTRDQAHVTSAPADIEDAGDDLRFASEDEAHDAFARRGWTDGMAVVLPTPERVARMLDATSRAPSEVVLRIDTRDALDATVGQIACNAVMAGLDPRHFDLLLTSLDAMGDEGYNLHAHTATMAGAQQVVVVRGPAVQHHGLRSEDGALGPGWPVNNRIGRAARLVIRNLLRSVHGEFDRAGFSHPGRFGWCVGEDHRTPWPLGPRDRSEVLVYATTWQASVINHEQHAEPLLDELGLAFRAACHANWLHRDVAAAFAFYATRPFLLVTGREHADVLVRDGYGDLRRLRQALYDRLVDDRHALRPVAIASPDNLHVLYVHASGMQQSWFFAPFQSHALVRRPI